MKNTIIAILVIILIGTGAYFFLKPTPDSVSGNSNQVTATDDTVSSQTNQQEDKSKTVIGTSVENRDVVAYHFGGGDKEIIFVGGIHGGYEWNTALVTYKIIDYLKEASSTIPANLRVTVIPELNPDGLAKVVSSNATSFSPPDIAPDSTLAISGRFNGHNVDLNRNFDCDWQPEGKWQTKTVDAGAEAFSEPESRAIKNYIETSKPVAVIVYYSAAGGVFASNCHNGVSAETDALTKTYANASGYPAFRSFDFYATTGDMTNWLAKINVPAISVLLTNHTDTEWTKNLAGVKAILNFYSK